MIELIVYLSGIVPGYLLVKRFFVKQDNEWTVSDRRFAILMSFGSWINLVVYIIATAATSNDNRPAKW